MNKLLVAWLVGLASLALAQSPVTLRNCGLELKLSAPPKRAVTMNQAATEVMLALGLQDRMVGTAYLDDAILPEYAAAYAKVPVLAKQYPSKEVLLGAQPDFVYGSYASAFGKDAAGSRAELLKLGITPYVSPMACEDRNLRPRQVSFEDVYGEILDIGRIFGVEARARALVAQMRSQGLRARVAAAGQTPLRVFWYDSGIDKPYVGACCGAPGMIMRQLGVRNVFADAPGSWAEVSWEGVVAREIDVIVVIDADWSRAEEKIRHLTTNPTFANLKAVRERRFITIPFSYTTPGVRNALAVKLLSEKLYPSR
ncbi:MAG: ABC transporter substrate-binding protein [Meiothermus sp.]|uniref:ABC transporter substrate-binding protein n=1 Tax=Meiothermus sp. TaxID=1955249 RepID=UPI0025DCA1A1|nr:ABC transporter substrate-binding protein [Meiothermus sp.]MCS7068194.1 ABC transporter substrate-binding protein [Meiothermus sp.]MCX7739626.1 ABC transporter substrate-binding protein [Meiothermus sp.]MDW8426727.1 ABC transporter substrate-binding protein [Meiothermus sp.]